jgi:BlaI family penicillinase repressor
MDRKLAVTHTEWSIMELLWDAPRALMELVDTLGKTIGWSKSTVTTMVRRMTEKGLIRCDDEGEVKVYSPLVRREEAVLRETDDFLSRVYRGSVAMMMSAMTRKQKLSKAEIDELYAILREAEGGATDD